MTRGFDEWGQGRHGGHCAVRIPTGGGGGLVIRGETFGQGWGGWGGGGGWAVGLGAGGGVGAGLRHPGRDFWTVLQGLRSKGQERAAPGCREQCGSRVLKPEAAVVCLGA